MILKSDSWYVGFHLSLSVLYCTKQKESEEKPTDINKFVNSFNNHKTVKGKKLKARAREREREKEKRERE